MGLIDELKRKIDAQKKAEAERDDVHSGSSDYYDQTLRPALVGVYEYLSELADSLNYLKPKICMDYEIKGFGEVKGLRQHGYKVRFDEASDYVALSFTCEKNQSVEFEVQGEMALESQRAYFFSHGLEYQEKRALTTIKKIPASRFYVRCRIPVAVKFSADAERSRIVLDMYNLEYIGKIRREFGPQELTEECLDKLGNNLLRREGRLFRLELPAETLAEIRRKLREVDAKELEEKTASRSLIRRIRKAPQTTKERNQEIGRRFPPGASVYVLRSSGDLEAGWKVLPIDDSLPEDVRKAVRGRCVICSSSDTSADTSNYKIYSLEELEKIQDHAATLKNR
jgi:hypothetical protein